MRRSKLEILMDILKICIDGANKTKIVYLANINFKTASPYLDQLARNGLIDVGLNSQTKYKTTDKGIKFIENFEQTLELLGED